jgi:hypothetical protein
VDQLKEELYQTRIITFNAMLSRETGTVFLVIKRLTKVLIYF